MSIFDLIFIAVFLTSAGTILTAAFFLLLRKYHRSGRILRRFGIGAVIYLGVVISVSLVTPRRVLNIGDPQCFDDWCITVENAAQTPSDSGLSYVVTLRLSSRALRVAQRENGLGIYLIDDHGQRYDPDPGMQATPFNVLLQPGQSVDAVRVFHIPDNPHELNLVVEHLGWFPGIFIIGDGGSLFHKRTYVRLR